MWSYAEADTVVLGVVVTVLGIAAVAFVATRVFGKKSSGSWRRR